MDNDTMQKWAGTNSWCLLCALNARVLDQNMLNKACGIPHQILHHRPGTRSGMSNIRAMVDAMADGDVFYISIDDQGPYEAILPDEIARFCDLIEQNHQAG